MSIRIIILFLFFSSFSSFSQIKGETKSFDLNNNDVIIEKSFPPILSISEIVFLDENNNNTIEGLEKAKISFKINNTGKGSSRGLIATITNTNPIITGLTFSKSITLGNIAPNTSKLVEIPIDGSMDLVSGISNFEINFIEKTGLPPDQIKINIPTKAFDNPKIEIVDFSFLSDNGQISLGKSLILKALIQNTGQGIAEKIKVTFKYSNLIIANGKDTFNIESLKPGEMKEVVFEFIATKNYQESTIPISIELNEKYGKFSINKIASTVINAKTNGNIILSLESSVVTNKVNIERASLTAEIDKNIPLNPVKYAKRYALIIGNEDYMSRQNGLSSESNVAFAKNDANVFKDYALNTFGIEENHITLLLDATSSEIKREIKRIQEILTYLNGEGELIFYYAGHGFPDENTKTPYIIPVDVTASNLTDGINLFDVYRQLTASNPKKVTVFLDACFSGGGRNAGLVASRAVKIKPKQETIKGNIVIFSGTSEEQAALPYKNKSHGMYTYQLLKKIQESNGDIKYEDLFNDVTNRVALESLNINKVNQKPQVLYSEDIYETWKSWKIK